MGSSYREELTPIKKQFQYLRKLKQLKLSQLREHHSQIFDGTEFVIRLPKNLHREALERRLFWYYRAFICPDTEEDKEAIEIAAREILSESALTKYTPEEEILLEGVRERERFTKEGVAAMTIEEIDKWLATLGLHIKEKPPNIRRRCLWEYFNLPQDELPWVKGIKGQSIRVRRFRKYKNTSEATIAKLITLNPDMDYEGFVAKFGSIFPSTTRGYFTKIRWAMRRAGHNIPYLKSGPKRRRVKKYDY